MVSSTYLLNKFNERTITHIHSSNDVDTLDLIHICFGNKTTKHQLDVMQHKIDHTFKNTYVIVVTKYAWHNESTNKFATYLDVQHALSHLIGVDSQDENLGFSNGWNMLDVIIEFYFIYLKENLAPLD
jgi:hypothetical protein